MKTKQELILDFMLALAPSYLQIAKEVDALNELKMIETSASEDLYFMAEALTNEYLKNLG
jgi:hypothetical protein